MAGIMAGIALKAIQFLLRGITFACAAVVLGIYSYVIAILASNGLYVPIWVRAVEGLSGAATLYCLLGLMLLWCLAGRPAASSIALMLDACFIGAFIYIAWANREGAGSCTGPNLHTPLGDGPASAVTIIDVHGYTISIPSFHAVCQLETACLAVAIVACVFLAASILVELLLWRNYRHERAFGPGPANNYTYGSAGPGSAFHRRHRRGNPSSSADPALGPDASSSAAMSMSADPNALPAHAEPSALDNGTRLYANIPDPATHPYYPAQNPYHPYQTRYEPEAPVTDQAKYGSPTNF